mgnify:CR=1 FL=1
MNANFHKGKQIYDKELQSFNLCSSVLIRVSSDKDYSVLLCGEIHSKPYRKEDWVHIMNKEQNKKNEDI